MGARGPSACERCARRKVRCSHVAHTSPTDSALAEAMDRQTKMIGEFVGEMRMMRQAVDRLSDRSTSSSRQTGSAHGVRRQFVGDDGDDDVEMRSDAHVDFDMGGLDVGKNDEDEEVEEEEEVTPQKKTKGKGKGKVREKRARATTIVATKGVPPEEPSSSSTLPLRPRPRYNKGKDKST